MLTKMRNLFKVMGRQAHLSTIAGLPKLLSGAELAQSSWAVRIESYADVPDVYKGFFDHFIADGQTFPYTVLTTSHERFIHRQSEKIISDFGHEIYILERNEHAFEIQCYPLNGISYVEFGTALLASSFKIYGRTSLGVHTSSTLIFNSISDYMFKPILKRARFVTKDSTGMVRRSELEKFDHLVKANYKFMNFARHSLLGGEKVIHFLLQSEIRERLMTVLGKTYFRTISPTHMSILTDRELILIREDAARRKEDRYGGIWDYIPLDKIKSLSLCERTGTLLVLTILLPENTRFEVIYQVTAEEEINQLLYRYKELTTG